MSNRRINTRRLRERKQRKLYSDELNFVDDDLEAGRGFSLQEKLDLPKFSMEMFVQEMKGHEVTVEYFQKNGFQTPILVIEKSGLDISVPTQNFSVSDVKTCVGSRRMLDVMDVNTQKNSEMTMKDWARYYDEPNKNSLMNVISLEFSHTKLENYIRAPKVVRQLDWVDQAWPRELKLQQVEATNAINQMMYPKVQKYCLMSVKGCYTDFHIDFGGTSVWYHILKGAKVFWLIPPTTTNLGLYEKWVLSGKQADIFFGDSVEKCGRVHLTEGNTFFIPTGWIHAVYTPRDSLVFGGNFLHSFGIEMQIKIAQVENRTRVPQKFRYPFFNRMLWYVLDKYVLCLLGRSHLVPKTELSTIQIRDNVHITKLEYNGLKAIIYYLLSLPFKKLSPPSSIGDPSALIEDVRLLLKLHWDDNPNLAVTGRTVFCLHENSAPTLEPKKEPEYDKRVPCGKCQACERPDCTDCENCSKNTKLIQGDINRLLCALKICQTPILDLNTVCQICNESTEVSAEETLMECFICKEIVHPSCLEKSNENIDSELDVKNGILNEDLPNSWECPRCSKYSRIIRAKKKASDGKGRNKKAQKNNTTKMEVEDDDDDDDEYVAEPSSLSSNSSDSERSNELDEMDIDDEEISACVAEVVRAQTPRRRKEEQERRQKRHVQHQHKARLTEQEKQMIRQQIADEIIRNSTKSLRKPMYVVRPAPIIEPSDTYNDHQNLCLNKTCILSVFRYLSATDLITCALVCKTWARYSIAPELWKTIDFSHVTFTWNLLKSAVRRCPETLILDWTHISKGALQWVLERIGNLRTLSLRAVPYDSVSILSACAIPPLTSLDLSYVTGLTDCRLCDILKPFTDPRLPPDTEPKSRLRFLTVLKLAGTDISDISLHHIVKELDALCELDLSSCARITDHGISHFGLKSTQTIRKLDLSCCKLLTDACLEYLQRCEMLVKIDFRACQLISTSALIKFAAQSVHQLVVQDMKLVTKQM